DEPTVGIDPQSRRHILDAVRALAAGAGLTVLYTSPYTERVEYLCRHVALMDHGRLIAQGALDGVRALAGEAVQLRLPLRALNGHSGPAGQAGPTGPGAQDDHAGPADPAALQAALGLPVQVIDDELRVVLPEGAGQAPSVLNLLARRGLPLDGLRLETPNLETVFLALTGRGLRDGGLQDGGLQAGGPRHEDLRDGGD